MRSNCNGLLDPLDVRYSVHVHLYPARWRLSVHMTAKDNAKRLQRILSIAFYNTFRNHAFVGSPNQRELCHDVIEHFVLKRIRNDDVKCQLGHLCSYTSAYILPQLRHATLGGYCHDC